MSFATLSLSAWLLLALQVEVEPAAIPSATPDAAASAPALQLPAPAGTALGAAVDDREPGEIFVAANTAYADGDWAAAIAGYRNLVTLGRGTPWVRYNLANGYLRNGELGPAVAEYLRAGRSLPRDQNVAANLAFARQSSKDALEPKPPGALRATLFFWHDLLSPAELRLAALIGNALLWICVTLWLARRSELWRWCSLLLALWVAAMGGSWALHALRPERVAVVVPSEIEALAAPEPGAVVRFRLHAGAELTVAEERESWVRIELPDGQQGWIRAENAELVSL